MMKRIIFSAILIFTAFFSSGVIFGNSFLGEKVNIRIEGYDKTLLDTEMYGYAFSDVLRTISESGKINISVTSGSKFQISSVGEIPNGFFGGNDKWLAYIERGGEIITSDSLMEMSLISGDKLVLYYGEEGKTSVLTSFEVSHADGNSVFTTAVKNDVWEQVGGKWQINGELKPVFGARISVKVPNGNYRMLRTGSDGQVSTKFNQTGVYIYSAECYNPNGVPTIVTTDKKYFLYGMEEDSSITRAEAVSFVLSLYKYYPSDFEIDFEDLNKSHKRYDDICLAVKTGVAVGVGDGFFMPDEKVKLYELCVMLANASKLEANSVSQYQGVPQWANESVNICIQNGLLNNVELSWQKDVNSDIIIQIFKNKNAF